MENGYPPWVWDGFLGMERTWRLNHRATVWDFAGVLVFMPEISDGQLSELPKVRNVRLGKDCTAELSFDSQQTLTCIIKEIVIA